MSKVDLEKTEESEIKLLFDQIGSLEKQDNSRKTSIYAPLTMLKIDCVDQNKLWKILQEMDIKDHFTCLLRNLYAGQEATVRTRHGIMDWFQIGSCILLPCLFNLNAEYIM